MRHQCKNSDEHLNSLRKINYLHLEPEDFIEISDDEEEEEEENNENNFVDIESSLTKNNDNSSFSSPTQPLITKTNFEFNFDNSKIKKNDLESTINISPKLSIQSKLISPTIPNENITTKSSISPIFKWLKYFNNLNTELLKEMKEFQADITQKQLRQHLSRTIAERINDTSKKSFTNQEIAQLSNFFEDLFKGKTMISCRDNFEFKLEKENKRQNFYAMMTICDRYIEQIKWESELVEQTRLIIVLLMKNQPFFYEIFCARIVASLVLISFDLDKIIDLFEKENSQNNSALSHWISDEQIIFKLFCKVQLALKSLKTKENIDENEKENFWIKQRGPKLLNMFFDEIVKMVEDIPLCTPFVLEEMLKNLLSTKGIRQYPEFSHELKRKLIKMENLSLLELKEGTKRILISRQKYLICLLEAEINKLEEKK
uniref:MIF4G domain-containing protein n=1 Tax=Meloidogyne hapla TaxID=6305 RepID=A0A1I8BSJ2_MELHA